MGMIENHLAWCARRELRPTYIDEIRRTLTRLERTLGPLELVGDVAVEDWWANLSVCAGTRCAYAAHLSGFFRWLRYERIREDDPTERLIRPRQHRGLPRPIAEERLRLALKRAEPPLDAWLSLAAYMGFRACEIASLHGEDIRGDRILVRDGKGGKQRILPLHPKVSELLHGVPGRGPVFRNATGGQLTSNVVSQRTNRYLHGLGISETIHQCRHWFGTAVYRQSRDLRLTQELMGHSSPLTTAGYAAWASEAAAEVISALVIGEIEAEAVDGSDRLTA